MRSRAEGRWTAMPQPGLRGGGGQVRSLKCGVYVAGQARPPRQVLVPPTATLTCAPLLLCPPPSSRITLPPGLQQSPSFHLPCTSASLPPGPARPPTASTSSGKCEAEPVTSADTASGQPGGGQGQASAINVNRNRSDPHPNVHRTLKHQHISIVSSEPIPKPVSHTMSCALNDTRRSPAFTPTLIHTLQPHL